MTQPLSRRHVLAAAGAAFGAGLMPRSVRAAGAERLVVAGGALTEIVAALGAGDRIVGVDDTSLHPPALVKPLPKIGYLRTLAAEGILSLDPSLVIATDQAGPPPVIGQLRAVGTKLLIVPEGKRIDAALEMIARIAGTLDRETAGRALAASVAADLERATGAAAGLGRPTRVLFLLSTSQGTLMAAGRDTTAGLMIAAAGGENAVRGYSGYKPLSGEAALAADPEVILLPDHSAMALGGLDHVAALPALSRTRAVRDGRVHAMDALFLLGLGPRVAHAVQGLAALLHPSAVLSPLPDRDYL